LRLKRLLIPIILLTFIIGVVILAPSEAILGASIKWVYMHVAFTWGGSSLVSFAGLVGIVMIVFPMPNVARWLFPVEAAAVALYAVGFLLSLIAAWDSWGGVLWQEPRVISAMLVLGAGAAVVFILRHLVGPRLSGFIAMLYWGLLMYQVVTTAVVFHPAEPIGTSESTSIKMTFYVLGVLATALGVSLAMIIEKTRSRTSLEVPVTS
jgi:hypothetical protein